MSTHTQDPIGVCQYNGRTYDILWAGTTKYGDKLKLAYQSDHDTVFWIPREKASRVELNDTPQGNQAAWNERKREHRRRPQRGASQDDGPRGGQPRSAANNTSLGAGEDRRQEPDTAPIDDPAAEACYCASCGQRLPDPEIPF
jgi:hypothetical protein